MWILEVHLTNLAIGTPTNVAGPRILQIRITNGLKPSICVKSGSQLVRQALILDEAVFVRRPDGLFVKVLGLELAALDACYLRAYERGAVFEILRAILRPYFKLSVVCGQSLDMVLSLVGRCRIAGRGPGKCAVKFVFRRFKM